MRTGMCVFGQVGGHSFMILQVGTCNQGKLYILQIDYHIQFSLIHFKSLCSLWQV